MQGTPLLLLVTTTSVSALVFAVVFSLVLAAMSNVLQEAGGSATKVRSVRCTRGEPWVPGGKVLGPKHAGGGAALAVSRWLLRRHDLPP